MTEAQLTHAYDLLYQTELDAVFDETEDEDVKILRRDLMCRRDILLLEVEKFDGPQPVKNKDLKFLIWSLHFAWADVQDYFESENAKTLSLQTGVPVSLPSENNRYWAEEELRCEDEQEELATVS